MSSPNSASEHSTTIDPPSNSDSGSADISALPDGPFPRSFGRYVLHEIIGFGGMGRVYRATDTQLEIDVAVKIPLAGVQPTPKQRERFRREARALAVLNHPNLCRVFDFGEIDGWLFVALGFVRGQPLSEKLPLSPREAADILRTVALAMAHAHQHGIVHRDIKPNNIVIREDGQPVVVDFGIAARFQPADDRITEAGAIVGTIPYAAPEQITGTIVPASDIYSLGVVLYRLLTGEQPYASQTHLDRIKAILDPDISPPRPREHKEELAPALEAICLRAMEHHASDRFASMEEFADCIHDWLSNELHMTSEPVVDRSAIGFRFAGYGTVAPLPAGGQDRLYLDVGNALADGVVDHHQLSYSTVPTTKLVLQSPEHVVGAMKRWRRPTDPFVIAMHEHPDLDSVAASYLAICRLAAGRFPQGAVALANYLERIDAGFPGMTHANPFTLYTGYMYLAHRLALRSWSSADDQWKRLVDDGLRLVEFVTEQCEKGHKAIIDVDAFDCPGLFSVHDRQEVQEDLQRYRRKLADPKCLPRRISLRLPAQLGGRANVETLLVRDVQNLDDPNRCSLFKEWARADVELCPEHHGFAGLCIFLSDRPKQARRCILSVRPDVQASLWGLGQLLEEAETARRIETSGADDRVVDPQTGEERRIRPGYANADPWYDGRAHGFTIVDSPRSGTRLTADEIEIIFTKFGEREIGDSIGIV